MSSRLLFVCILALSRRNDAAPTMEHRMTVTKMSKEDLDSSATGYVYNQQSGLPVYYMQYTNHGSGGYYHPPDTVHYVVEAGAPVAHHASKTTPLQIPYATAEDVLQQGTGNYGNEQSLGHVVAPVDSVPRAPYYVDGKFAANEGNGKGGTYGTGIVEDHGDEDSGENDEGDEEDEEEEDDDDYEDIGGKIHGGTATGYDGGYGNKGIGKSLASGGSSFEAGKGEQYGAEEYSEHGDKGEKGYKTRQKFSEGESGGHDSEHQEGYYKENGGRKKGHTDEAEAHGSREEEENGSEGSNYGHSSHHKKGEKTKGFHNVYHKDEYKKETDFYDDDHKKGDFAEYEAYDKGYKNEEGGFKKGGHHSSGHDQQNHGEKGHYDKGHHDSKDLGHEAAEGGNSYYSNHEDYGAKKGSQSAKSHKFSKDDR